MCISKKMKNKQNHKKSGLQPRLPHEVSTAVATNPENSPAMMYAATKSDTCRNFPAMMYA